MTQVVIDPASLAAIAAIKTDIANLATRGGIKSIQRGVTTPSSASELAVTISSVNTSKATAKLLTGSADSAWDAGVSGGALSSAYSVRLISSTSVGVTGFVNWAAAGGGSSGTVGRAVSWEVVEYY